MFNVVIFMEYKLRVLGIATITASISVDSKLILMHTLLERCHSKALNSLYNNSTAPLKQSIK
jgi:hypothetical protein